MCTCMYEGLVAGVELCGVCVNWYGTGLAQLQLPDLSQRAVAECELQAIIVWGIPY